jgi:uncharacterized membrane protein YhdT
MLLLLLLLLLLPPQVMWHSAVTCCLMVGWARVAPAAAKMTNGMRGAPRWVGDCTV